MNLGNHIAQSKILLGLLAAAFALPVPAHSADTPEVADRFITLGTMGGPIPDPQRSQPANVLVVGRDAYLIDAGDGAAEQLAKAGIRLPQVKAVVLSHLHFDHTGGLAAVLGLRFQTNVPGKLRIVGPPGTREMVAGLVASMKPAAEAGYGDPSAPKVDPADLVEVAEIGDGATFRLGTAEVTARQNTHYSFAPGSEQDLHFKSLSFRFDLPDRSIVYTGDTGPSRAVEELARGADLLVSEMIDVERTVANVRQNTPDMTPDNFRGLTWHLSHHHLTAEQVGVLAQAAGVKRVVVTHVVAPNASKAQLNGYVSQIAAHYGGPAEIADDLDAF